VVSLVNLKIITSLISVTERVKVFPLHSRWLTLNCTVAMNLFHNYNINQMVQYTCISRKLFYLSEKSSRAKHEHTSISSSWGCIEAGTKMCYAIPNVDTLLVASYSFFFKWHV
jgi:hypothetical protein